MSLASWWDDEKGVKYEEIFIRMTVFVFDRECMRWQGRQKLRVVDRAYRIARFGLRTVKKCSENFTF